MKLKQLIALTYAISAGSLAIGLTASYMNTMKSELHEKYRTQITKPEIKPKRTITVITAAKPLSFGTRLRRSDLRKIRVPEEGTPLNVYHTIESIFVSGKEPILQATLAEGQLLLPKQILQASETAALAAMLPVGLRAATIRVNEIRGVGGFVQPRDRVDILLTENAKEDDKSHRAARVLLQNVLVMAIGQEIMTTDQPAKVKNSVTVAVNLEDAQKLALAVTVGQLSLALRNPRHPVIAETRSVSLSDLYSQKSKNKLGASKIEVFRAAKASVYTISSSVSAPKR